VCGIAHYKKDDNKQNKDDNKLLQWYNGETKLQCCSAWQKRQTMDGVAGAFVEHQHLFDSY
jgi:hypothetical protein